MGKIKAALAIFSIVTVGAFSAPLAAQDMGFYVGGSLGQSKFDGVCIGGLISCDEKDNSWKVFGGYQLNRNFAVELGYTDLGEANVRGPGGTASVEATAWELMAVGMLPVADRFSVYGKLGVYFGDIEARNSLGFSASDDGTELTFGFGARYDFTRNLAVRAEWQQYKDFSDIDVTVMSVGILYRF